MRPPVAKRLDILPSPSDSKSEALEEKKKFAQHLHNQGINPARWTEAHPAPQAEQMTYQATGQKPRDNQFEVDGKLYNWSPSVTATAKQTQAITDSYIAERRGIADPKVTGPKIEDIVDIAEVPLKHPFGTPHFRRPANDVSAAKEHAALLHHYAQSGIDPDKAHLGDPLPMKEQERFKAQITKTLPGDTSEISGLPIFYQGFDDGWIYKANEATRAKGEIKAVENEPALANDDYRANLGAVVQQNTQGGNLDQGSISDGPDAAEMENRFNENARSRITAAANQVDAVISAIERAQTGAKPTEADVPLLSRIKDAFARVGIEFNPANANLDYAREVAKAIRRSASLSGTEGSSVPFHQIVQSQNVQLAQALVGSTMEWGRVKYLGPSQAISAVAKAPRNLNLALAMAAPVAAAYALGKTAPEIAKKQAEEDAAPNLFSPYESEDGALVHGKASISYMPSSSDILQRLSATDVQQINTVFSSQASTFDRSLPTPMSSDQKADVLTSGTVSEIELFGLPIYLTDPRGNEQTQDRIDKLKRMVRDKLIECGMEESFEWGGKIEDEISKRAKERFVPQGESGVRGARRADLSFKVSWFGRTYIIDINTVDVLKNGSMTKAERIAAEGLRLNRLIRLSINETLPDSQKLEEYEGRIGTVPKGKDMSDDEWEAAAKEWVDSFLDCDEPLEADVYLDPESKHPWPGKE
ncbi:hypothetical protein [Dongia sp.]|uniref:hypothetical protein n=1 Tax=Dongia sp. TaxID=1977262 RepID=UPI0035B1B661